MDREDRNAGLNEAREDANEIVKAAARVLAKAALGLFVVDPHAWSDRPCSTCKQISDLLGEPWGCYEYQIHLKREEIRRKEMGA